MKRLIFSFIKEKKKKKKEANWVGTGQSDPESRPNLLNQVGYQVCSDIATLNKSYFNYLPSEYMQK